MTTAMTSTIKCFAIPLDILSRVASIRGVVIYLASNEIGNMFKKALNLNIIIILIAQILVYFPYLRKLFMYEINLFIFVLLLIGISTLSFASLKTMADILITNNNNMINILEFQQLTDIEDYYIEDFQ